MFILTSEMKKRVSYEMIGLFQKDLDEETHAAWDTCLKTIEQYAGGKTAENELTDALSNYDYLNSQFMFENGMKLGAKLAMALFKDGVVA